jgi:hypothetical protein
MFGALGGIRTPDARLRTAALYPLSYEGTQGEIGALGGTRTPDLKVRNLALYPLSYERAPVDYTRFLHVSSLRQENQSPL